MVCEYSTTEKVIVWGRLFSITTTIPNFAGTQCVIGNAAQIMTLLKDINISILFLIQLSYVCKRDPCQTGLQSTLLGPAYLSISRDQGGGIVPTP